MSETPPSVLTIAAKVFLLPIGTAAILVLRNTRDRARRRTPLVLRKHLSVLRRPSPERPRRLERSVRKNLARLRDRWRTYLRFSGICPSCRGFPLHLPHATPRFRTSFKPFTPSRR